MKKFLYTILLIGASIAQVDAQPYVMEWDIGTFGGSGGGTCTFMEPPLQPQGAYRIYHKTDPNTKVYCRFLVNASSNYYLQPLVLDNIKLGTNSNASSLIDIAGDPTPVDILFLGKNLLTTQPNISSTTIERKSNIRMTLAGRSITDTLEMTANPANAVVSITGKQNSSFKYNGGVLLTSNPIAIATTAATTIHDTIMINKGVIASTTAGSYVSIGKKPATAQGGSENVIINGGTVDSVFGQKVIINGGTVQGGARCLGAGEYPKNSAGDSVFVGKLHKPKIEGVWVDGKNYNIRRNHNGNDTLYLYMPHKDAADDTHTVKTMADGIAHTHTAHWDNAMQQFLFASIASTIPRSETNVALTFPTDTTGVYNDGSTRQYAFTLTNAAATTSAQKPISHGIEPQEIIVKFNDSIIYKTTLGYKFTSETISSLNIATNGLNAGKYPVTIEYGGTDSILPALWSGYLIVNKVTPTFTLPQNLTADCGDSLKVVALPRGWTWIKRDTVGYAGQHNHKVRFTPIDSIDNYEYVDTSVVITVAKATPSSPPQAFLMAVSGDVIGNIELHKNNPCWQWADSSLSTGITSGTSYTTREFSAIYSCQTDCCYKDQTTLRVNVLDQQLPTTTAVYGDSLKDVLLPPDWEWHEIATTELVGNAGNTYYFKARFNYSNGLSIITTKVAVEVKKRRPDFNMPTSLEATYGKVLGDIPLWDATHTSPADTGWRWQSPSDPVGTAATGNNRHQYKVWFIPSDTINFETIDTALWVTVNKAYPIFTAPLPIATQYLTKLSAITPPAHWVWQNPDDTVGNVGLRKRRAWYYHNNDTANYLVVDSALWLQVGKATPVAPPAQVATYGDMLSAIELPVPWTWVQIDSSVGKAGVRTHKAKVKDADTANYVQRNQDVIVNVQKATPTYSKPTNIIATYGDMLYKVPLWDTTRSKLSNRDTCWHWASPNLKVGNAGMHQHPAIFIPIDTANYLTITDTLNVYVKKAKPKPTLPATLTAFTGDTLGVVALSARWLYMYENAKLYGSWQWYYPDDNLGKRGYQMHKAIFTMQDTANWDTVQRMLIVFVAERTKIEVTKSLLSADNPRHWVVELCTTNDVEVRFTTDSSVKVLYDKRRREISTLAVDVHKPNVYVIPYTLRTVINNTEMYKEDTLTIERKFRFNDIVVSKKSRLLFVNNNSINTGYRFVAYQWWRGNEPVGDGLQYYHEGTGAEAITISPTTPYRVTMTTEDGKQINTCEGYATQVSTNLKVRPNPVSRDGSLTLEFPTYIPKSSFEVRIYTLSGALVSTRTVDQYNPTISLSDVGITMPGIYVLKSTELGETLFVVE
jgi:hypothetical protein